MWHLRKEGTRIRQLPISKKLIGQARIDWWEPQLEGTPLAPRRRLLSPIQHAQATAQAKQWLDKGVIAPITTPPLLNNLVLVAKKDGRVRVCIDCTPANKVTKAFDWPLPRLQDIRYRIQGSTWFARLDLRDAFFRIQVPAKDRHLTAFMVGSQAYHFTRMPFGLKTAPSVFQRFMDWGLSEFTAWCVWYIDDILITAESESQLASREVLVRKRLREMRCEINEDKSETHRRSLIFAGLTLFAQGVGPDGSKLAELLSLPVPRNKSEAQSALGLVSYLRDFIPLVGHFTSMLYPNKDGLRLPAEEYTRQWKRLLSHIASAATSTRRFEDDSDAELYTDASGYAVGVVLVQDRRIVAVASRKLSPAECRYSATDREHLGLVFAAKRFRLFLHRASAQTRVWSDHSALVSRKPDELTPRQMRWHTLVQAWMPNVSHVRGKVNPADFISRLRLAGVGANF